jgi:hypothetical protein
LVANLSYLGADGEHHVGVRGEEVLLAPEGVQHFDWLQAGTPEAQRAKELADVAAAERESKRAASPAESPAAEEASAE